MVPGQTNDFTENPDAAPEVPQADPADSAATSCVMTHELIHHLIEALREELKQFGEMLVLLDHQQELVRTRRLPDLSPSAVAINTQAETIRAARHEREQRRRDLALRLDLAEDCSLVDLLPHLPSQYRPLLEALLRENYELQIRIQSNARENHVTLSRAVEVMQRLLVPLAPRPSS